MKHIIVTLNTLDIVETMNGYSGVELIKTDDDFAIWYCVDLSQADIDAIQLTGLILLNKPA